MLREKCSDARSPSAASRPSDSQLQLIRRQSKTEKHGEECPGLPPLPLLRLHPVLYACSWLGVLFVHGLAAHYHLRMSRLYSKLHSTSMADRLVAFDIIDASVGSHLPTHRGIHITIFVLHAMGATMMLKNSLEDQTLTFYNEDQGRWGFNRFTRWLRLLQDEGHWLRVTELGLHTVVAYRTTTYAASGRQWCHAYVALLVLSCVLSSISAGQHHRFVTGSFNATRLMIMVLQLFGTVVSPLVLLAGYKAFTRLCDFIQWLQDVWAVAFWGNMQVILYVSWADTLARVVLSLMLVLDLLYLKMCIRKRAISRATTPLTIRDWIVNIDDSIRVRARVETNDRKAASSPRFSPENLKWILTVVFIVWGITVAVIHGQGHLESNPTVCNSSRSPWFTSKSLVLCPLIDINCVELRIDGRQNELDVLWQQNLDPTTVQILVVRHCVQLEVPASIQNFTNLKILRIYNSTIASWPAESAIEATSMPRLHTLNLLSVNFTDGKLPPGLLSADLPSSLRAIAIVETNLRALPDDLDLRWNALLPQVFLSIENSNLTEFPSVLMRLRVASISLAYNAIRDIPAELFQLDHLYLLNLASTGITRLPTDVTKLGSALSVFSILNTAVEDIPSWFDPFLSEDRVSPSNTYNQFRLKAGSTKWCNSLVANLREPRVAAYAAKTDCGAMDPLGFPLGFIEMMYNVSCSALTDTAW